MSLESLARLQEAHAFDPAPRRSELHDLHVPFDEMTGGRACEQSLGDALRRGHRVALVGISGSGKSSVTQSVLGPLVEGLAPLPITVAIERPEIAQDPAEFASHLVRLVGQWVVDAMPQQARRGREITTRSGHAGANRQRFSVTPEWLSVKLELAYELQQASAQTPLSSGQRMEQARQLLDLIRADDLEPVLVLDDTDKWLNTTWQPAAASIRAAFFGRVIRVLAEELSTAAVVAVHPSYLADSAYQSAAGFLDTTIHVPAIPGAEAVGQILGRRAGLALGVRDERLALNQAIAPDAVGQLYGHYARHVPDMRKHVVLTAHVALAIACDDDADQIQTRHLEAAITETSNG
jgi:ABC-type dipeptide/oligopeptide/nickel transport system ATPase subunit